LSYTQFCVHYRHWRGRQELVMRFEYVAGERMFVDFCGDTLGITDPETGQLWRAPVFACALGASGYLYAEATGSQNLACWLGAHVNALNAYGGSEQIRQAVAYGAAATPIGQPVPAQGAFVQPTILTGVTADNPVYNQEIFGPVLMLFGFRDEAEAIRLANDTQFGLGASVYSTNIGHAYTVAEQLEAGAVTINQPTLPSPSIPFGGVKNSGYGRELGAAGIREFTNQKVINAARLEELVA
jgi:hypothetical protein